MRDIPRTTHCEKCGLVAEKILSQCQVGIVKTGLLNDGKPEYVSQLARRMPKGKMDPKAYFTHKSQVQDAARRKADSADGYELQIDH
jgi:hypothetical protein